ncbi:alpha-galactosidase [Microbacterium sp. Au-Mic1]|uniref:alpha-galactosidase n=1 Tax=Microbacterium sp. Au-Mic1 TaxID=2906457 RepID=UPI001E38785B|nr:alpha-galactosidase [Microbacterium sp. Au-Mic1]MCE4027169.1 alpha-galactosidase [Microbacterium sp. Au-Mic1]
MRLPSEYIHLAKDDVSLLLRTTDGKPEFVHWGASLGSDLPQGDRISGPVPQSFFNARVPQHLVPEAGSGWLATPGLRIGREGNELHGTFTIRDVSREAAHAAVITQRDVENEIELITELRLEDAGLVRMRHTLANTSSVPLDVHHLLLTFPLPDRARELLDTTGRWCREVQPQRHVMGFGTWMRPTRHGRTGHDAPLVFAAGTPGFGFRHGEVWSVHLAWSGNAQHYVEKSPSAGYAIGAGEILEQGDVVLARNEAYSTPWIFASYSRNGLDAAAAQFHRWDRASRVGVRPRPVTVNSWEAVYFEHESATLLELIEAAARIGAERFVLDDGWFLGRRSDAAGLGDWSVDPAVWPRGLGQIVDRVHDLGMEFGLWVEPEMISPDSDLAREHPDWISRLGKTRPLTWRNQQLLDLTDAAAWDNTYAQLDRLLNEYRIDYLKWDYNRDSTEIGDGHTPRAHAQVEAAYRLLDTIRARHPDVEIENCSSGGGRVDLGIGARTDRVWISDTNDPVERYPIQRWAMQLIPPERLGCHIGAPRSHTTGRVTDLAFRVSASWMHHLGVEWDIRSLSAEDEGVLANAIRLHKTYRELLHSGEVVRGEGPDGAHLLHGVVSPSKDQAIFQYVALQPSTTDTPSPVGLPALQSDAVYRIRMLLSDARDRPEQAPPSWMLDGIEASGRFLREVGLHMPLLHPQSAVTFSAELVSDV